MLPNAASITQDPTAKKGTTARNFRIFSILTPKAPRVSKITTAIPL